MRILISTQHFHPEAFRINSLAEALAREGCKVTVLTAQPNYPDGRIYPGYRASGLSRGRHGAIALARVPIVPRGSASSRQLALNYLSFMVSASLFGPFLLRGQQFDAILVYGTSPILQAIPAILLRLWKMSPLIVWVQDLWPESLVVTGHVTNARIIAWVDRVVRWIYRRADLLLGQSWAFVETIAAKAPGVPVDHLPNPGDLIEAEGAPAPIELGGGFHIVFAGNLGKAQALPTILSAAEAVADLPDIRLHLVGSGSEEGWVRQQIAARGLGNVVLHGRIPAAAIPGTLGQADALLITLARADILSRTVPSKVQTYLQIGRPILAAIDGEGGQVIRDAGAGIVVPAEDSAALADAMRQLYRLDSAERSRIGSVGRAYFDRHFDPQAVARALIGKIRRLSGTKGML